MEFLDENLEIQSKIDFLTKALSYEIKNYIPRGAKYYNQKFTQQKMNYLIKKGADPIVELVRLRINSENSAYYSVAAYLTMQLLHEVESHVSADAPKDPFRLEKIKYLIEKGANPIEALNYSNCTDVSLYLINNLIKDNPLTHGYCRFLFQNNYKIPAKLLIEKGWLKPEAMKKFPALTF